MGKPPFEVADVFRLYGEDFLRTQGASVSPAQRRVLSSLINCRTSALGGHVDQCDRCDHQVVSYNSCRDRHCPKCLASASREWLDARKAELLPVPYFHVVFTLPEELRPVALQNKKVVYDLLFEAASKTLLTIAADPKHLGAQVGFIAVLHTWSQSLLDHPHLHCVVPGGGLASDRSRWIGSRTDFFLPVRVLSALYRGKFLALLHRRFERGELAFHGKMLDLKEPGNFSRWIEKLRQKAWVVYAKPPFGGPEQVLKYLARYTHRVAISNHRLLSVDGGRVTFRWKDYADGSQRKQMTLDGTEFIRRFLLHVLPRAFVRIRHYGFLGNRRREENLALCRRLLAKTLPEPTADLPAPATTPPDQVSTEVSDPAPKACPACKQGRMIRVHELAPFEELKPRRAATQGRGDTS